LEKLKSVGRPLEQVAQGRFYYGIKTGLNEAFVITHETRRNLIQSDKRSAELIKPWLQGREIKRWHGEPSGLFVIAIPYRFHKELKDYPAILEHLGRYKAQLQKRGQCRSSRNGDGKGQHHWLELDNNPSEAYLAEFKRPKIVFNETSKRLHAFVDRDGLYVSKTGFILLPDDPEYVLSVLNSNALDWLCRMEFPCWGDPWKGGRIQFRGDRMLAAPIPSADRKTKARLAQLAKHAKRASTASESELDSIEDKINVIVSSLFGLTRDEIEIIEGSSAKDAEGET